MRQITNRQEFADRKKKGEDVVMFRGKIMSGEEREMLKSSLSSGGGTGGSETSQREDKRNETLKD